MTRIDFIEKHHFDPEPLHYRPDFRKYFYRADLGEYVIQWSKDYGYELIKNNVVVLWAADLSKYSHG